MTDTRRSPTMQDVARAAGVSQATVSLVLNGVAGVRVSDQTRARVLDEAERLGYRRAARVRADIRQTASVGLIIDDVAASPFAAPLLEGAREAAWEQGAIVEVVSTRNDPAIEAAAIESMLARPLIGIVYATLLTREASPPTLPAEVPVVLLNCYGAPGSYASALPDDAGATRGLMAALIAAGHRRIAHIAGETFLDAGRDRLQGYRRALVEHDIPFDPGLVVSMTSQPRAGYEGAALLLDGPAPPTAITCYTDRMALGAMEAARERGLAVPQDVSIVGFDNDPFVVSLFPELTTAILPHEPMARWAVEQLFAVKAGHAPKPRRRRFACEIVHRGSIAAPRHEPA